MPKPTTKPKAKLTKEEKQIAELLRELRLVKIGMEAVIATTDKVIEEAKRHGFVLEELDERR